MILLFVTGCLVVALAVNHVVYGFGCWGHQTGGSESGLIYGLQILAAAFGVGWLAVGILLRRIPVRLKPLMGIAICAAASVFMFKHTGWRAFTSIHHQGEENLLAFLPVVLTCVAVGTYGWWDRSQAGREGPGDTLANGAGGTHGGEETGNPYQPPLT